jgi:hypothetical protein
MRHSLPADNLRFVPLRIYDTEKTERLVGYIPQLMRLVRFDIERIKKSDLVSSFSGNTDTMSPDTYYHMLVIVHFETAETIGSDFKISQVELR